MRKQFLALPYWQRRRGLAYGLILAFLVLCSLFFSAARMWRWL